MKSWLGACLLLITLLAFGCTRGEPKQARAANEKSVAAPQATLPLATKAEGEAARSVGKGDESTPNKGTKPGRKFALLVGVTKYDTLKVNELIGPANDVALMSKMLKDRFDFTDKDIVVLADSPGSAGRPTRANIKRHFDRLAKEARAGDQMVVLLGGHGENQPETVVGSEPDGLDQIFLPCDAGPFNEMTKKVNNAIIDDELGLWTKAITDGGASLWVIVDACHSGTMLRGDEVDRGLPEGTLVPVEVLREARKAAAARKEETRGGPEKPAAKPENSTPRLVALYACQRDQTAPELTAPSDGKIRHGLLTYTVCQVLYAAKTKLTYKELKDRIDAKYRYECRCTRCWT